VDAVGLCQLGHLFDPPAEMFISAQRGRKIAGFPGFSFCGYCLHRSGQFAYQNISSSDL
jgi:hypothetical protein